MASKKTSTRRQDQVEATCQRILDAAISLYTEYGVEATSISMIIERSGVGRTTFYRYFDDHDAVLNLALLRGFEGLIEDFEDSRYEHSDIEAQIVDDIIWFHRQMQGRPALTLLFRDNNEQFYQRIKVMLARAREAGLTCVRPTFERAQAEGRLREGVTLESYVNWATFVVTSLQTVPHPFVDTDFQLRDMLRHFLVPSLIKDSQAVDR